MSVYRTLISCEQLTTLIQNNTAPIILDCRFSLADTAYGQAQYAEGHIPGAVFMHLDNDLSSPITDQTGRHPLPDAEKLAESLRQAGLSRGRQVVVYDDCGGAMASRAWWVLRWLGHSEVAVLDGAYPAWTAAGGAVETATPAPLAGDFGVNLQQAAVLTTEQVMAAQAMQQAQLVDARGAERFRGEQEPIDPVAGHIPDALNRPMTDNLCDGFFKSAEELGQEWLQCLEGHSPEDIVHYCGSGVTACHNLLAMEIAGQTGSRLYAGSWSEWIRDPARPVATGE